MITKDRSKVSFGHFQRQRMINFARRLLREGEKEYAEEIVQEACIHVLKHAQIEDDINDYLLKTVRTVCRERFGRRSADPPDPVDRDGQTYFKDNLDWKRGSDPNYPFEAQVNGDRLVVRLNDFPDATLYTLLVNDEEAADFDDWPELWTRK